MQISTFVWLYMAWTQPSPHVYKLVVLLCYFLAGDDACYVSKQLTCDDMPLSRFIVENFDYIQLFLIICAPTLLSSHLVLDIHVLFQCFLVLIIPYSRLHTDIPILVYFEVLLGMSQYMYFVDNDKLVYVVFLLLKFTIDPHFLLLAICTVAL